MTPAVKRSLLAITSGVIYALGQPGWDLWPLGFVCGVPLLAAIAGRPTAERAWLGWLAGTAATCCATVVPAAISSSSYFGLPMWQAVIIALTVGQVFGAGSFAVLSVWAGPLTRDRPGIAALRIALAWTAAEFLRSKLFTGLPWILLGQSLTPVPALLQPAAWLGAPGVTLLVAAANAGVWQIACRPVRRQGLPIIAVVVCAFGAAWFARPFVAGEGRPGSVALVEAVEYVEPVNPVEPVGSGGNRALRVLLVQGNFPKQRGATGVRDEIQQLVELSDRPDVDLAIWPESSVRAVLPLNAPLVAAAWRSAGHTPRQLVLGAARSDPARPGTLWNSALLFEEGQIRASHDKVHLLPFGEYVPAPFAALGLRGRRTTAGGAPRVLDGVGPQIGALVCYEIAFEELAREITRGGAQLIVNLSNDGWFGRTGAIEQHFSAAVFRAIETGRPVLRATNTGVTAAVDASGRVVARAPLLEPAVLELEVVPGGPDTAYQRTGNWLGPAALIAATGMLAWSHTGRKKRELS